MGHCLKLCWGGGTEVYSDAVPWPGFSWASLCSFVGGGDGWRPGLCLFGLLSFSLRMMGYAFLGCKLLCCWFSTVGFLVCSPVPFSFAPSLSLSLSLPLLLCRLFFSCLIEETDVEVAVDTPELASVPWLSCVPVFRLLSMLTVCLGLRTQLPSTLLGVSSFLSFACFWGACAFLLSLVGILGPLPSTLALLPFACFLL